MNFETRLAREPEGVAYYEDTADADARRKRRWLIIGVVVAIIAIAGAIFAYNRSTAPAAGAAGEAKESPTVSVVVPGRQPVANVITAAGSLAARREMPVGVVGEGGLVTRVWVEPGTWVGAGQVLASIERSVQAQDSAQLAAQVNVAQADARLAQAELERATALVSRGFVSKADVDRRTATRDAALARVKVAQAQLAGNRARIGRLDIRAPAAGLVLTRSVEPGQVVGGGSGVLFRMAQGGQMEMRALLAEADITRVSAGQSASVVPVGSQKSFNGQIWQVSPVIDPQSRQGTVRIALAYDPALRPGGFASAQITSGQVEAPLLPESAVLSDPKGNYVFIVGPDNKVARRDVKVGTVNDRGVTIVNGLSGTESVILSAGGFLNPGETVIPAKTKLESAAR